MDETRRALVIVLPCYGALEIVGVIIIIIIITDVISVALRSRERWVCVRGLWAASSLWARRWPEQVHRWRDTATERSSPRAESGSVTPGKLLAAAAAHHL